MATPTASEEPLEKAAIAYNPTSETQLTAVGAAATAAATPVMAHATITIMNFMQTKVVTSRCPLCQYCS